MFLLSMKKKREEYDRGTVKHTQYFQILIQKKMMVVIFIYEKL